MARLVLFHIGIHALGQEIFLHINLNAAGLVHHIHKRAAAHIPPAHHTAGHGNTAQLLGALIKFVDNLLSMGIHIKRGNLIGIVAVLLHIVQFFPANPAQLADILRRLRSEEHHV